MGAHIRIRSGLEAALLSGLAALLVLAVAGAGDVLVGTAAPVLQLLACALVVLWGWSRPRERLAWCALAAGLALAAFGNVHEALQGDARSLPSLADFLHLACYPLTYAGVILLLRARVRGVHASMWLDGVIGSLGVATVAAAVVFGPVLAATNGDMGAIATSLAYPVGDVLLLGMIVGAVLMGWDAGRGWHVLAGAMALAALNDSAHLYQVAAGAFPAGGLLDLAAPAAAALTVIAARLPHDRRTDAAPGRDRWLLLAPVGSTVVVAGVLIYDHFADVGLVAVVLAALTLAAALVRTSITFAEVRALADSNRAALTDDLTGLANRRAFYEQVGNALARARSDDADLSLLVIDLDRLKELNDTLGHDVGDMLLCQVGPRIRSVLPDAHTVARLGGDVFGVLLNDRPGEDESLEAAAAIRAALASEFEVDEVSVHIEASVGIGIYPQHGAEAGELLRHADVAMYQAKTNRTGAELYAPERDSHSRERLALMGELRNALDREELVVYYQPKADLRTSRVTGAEALVRWQHPERGLLGPYEFLPMAEQTGLMRPLTLYVLARALRQTRRWHDAGRPLSIAVNLGVPNMLDLQLPSDIERLLEETGVEAHYLKLEITENVVMEDPIRTIEVLKRLRAIGVGLSLDDFGTGYSSLAYLKQLAVDELKIDRSFVMHMADDEDDAVIVRSTVDLARNLNLRVVAEGVEDERSWSALARMGCQVAQGFFLSKPVPADQFGTWLEEWERQAPAPTDEDLGVFRVPDETRV